MSRAYLTMWSQPQVEIRRRSLRGQDKLDHTAGTQFRSRGVTPGDRIYVLATRQGRLLLLGRLHVQRVVGQHEADRHFGTHVYEAPDHLIGTGTDLRLDREVPENIARLLQRESGKHLRIDPDHYRVEANSLRSTGRITEQSAALLDTLLDQTIDTDTDTFLEGGRQLQRHLNVERSPHVRERALAHHGTDCQVCGFSFQRTYGPLGDGFAEIHHLVALASLKRRMPVDPAKDVAVLCANCHRMAHRENPPISLERLRGLLRA